MNEALNLIQSFFNKWNYLCLFLGLFLEGTFFTGFLVPGTLILVFGGYWAANEGGSIFASIVLSLCGILIGDNVSYLIGRSSLSKIPLFKRFKNFALSTDIANKRYTVFYQFTSLTRGLLPFYLGLNNYPYRKWLSISITASIIFVTVMFWIGYFGGVYWHNIKTATDISRYTQYIFNIILIIIIVNLVYKSYKKLK